MFISLPIEPLNIEYLEVSDILGIISAAGIIQWLNISTECSIVLVYRHVPRCPVTLNLLRPRKDRRTKLMELHLEGMLTEDRLNPV